MISGSMVPSLCSERFQSLDVVFPQTVSKQNATSMVRYCDEYASRVLLMSRSQSRKAVVRLRRRYCLAKHLPNDPSSFTTPYSPRHVRRLLAGLFRQNIGDTASLLKPPNKRQVIPKPGSIISILAPCQQSETPHRRSTKRHPMAPHSL